jgi:hypothetical protein
LVIAAYGKQKGLIVFDEITMEETSPDNDLPKCF